MTQTFIPGKDAASEGPITHFQQKLFDLGFQTGEASWLSPVPNVRLVHICDKECALCFTNGKGAIKKAALTSALDEHFEYPSTSYFLVDFWLGRTTANGPFVHYPNEKWFPLTEEDDVPRSLLDARLRTSHDPDNGLIDSMLIDPQSGNEERSVYDLPFIRQSDSQTVYIPMNTIGNLYVSNDMSAGSTPNEARVQGLSEVFEYHVRNHAIAESISLPEIPAEVMACYPAVVESIATPEAKGFPILAYGGSLGSKHPMIYAVLFNPANGICFASLGVYPDFGVMLERIVAELLQDRGLRDLDVFTLPAFDDEEAAEHTNLETHFIDSSGLTSQDLFKQDADYPFVDWNFSGTTEEELATLMVIFSAEDKEVYTADYRHLGTYTCCIIVPGMSDIYPVEDLWLANNAMGTHPRDTIFSLPGSEWDKEGYLSLVEQLDEEGFDDLTHIHELLGLATGVSNGWYTLRTGELKVVLMLAGDDLEQALVWTERTMKPNASVFSAERVNYYRCLRTLSLLSQEEDRQPLQHLSAFVRMYGAEAVEAVSATLSGEALLYELQSVNNDLHTFLAHQSLLRVYEKL